MEIDTRVELNNKTYMPLFGLGVFLAQEGEECQQAVEWALEAGYRLIDTASFYGNEQSVGAAVQNSKVAREDIFVTTKLWNSDHGYDKALRAFDESISTLGLDYVDLYLIHYPVEGLRLDTWKAMEVIAKDERCKAVGVSNYMSGHLEELLNVCTTAPAVNQIELSPFCFESRREIVDLCRSENIILQAYSPLARTRRFDHPPLVALADKYRKTPAQILVRWALQKDLSVIPKSSSKNRIEENANIFDFAISAEDMKVLAGFDENYIVAWDPTLTP